MVHSPIAVHPQILLEFQGKKGEYFLIIVRRYAVNAWMRRASCSPHRGSADAGGSHTFPRPPRRAVM